MKKVPFSILTKLFWETFHRRLSIPKNRVHCYQKQPNLTKNLLVTKMFQHQVNIPNENHLLASIEGTLLINRNKRQPTNHFQTV